MDCRPKPSKGVNVPASSPSGRHPAIRCALAALVACASLAVVAIVAAVPATAAEQTDRIPLDSIGPAPAAGTLANQVGWSVNVGVWDDVTGQGYAFSTDSSPQVFSFDHPVAARFGIAGLNVDGECMGLPEGTVAETVNAHHQWDPGTGLVCQTAGAAASDESVFTHPNPPFQLELRAVGAPGGPIRGPTFIELTYDLPEASIAVPVEGASYPLGSSVLADFTCAPGGGAIISANASAPQGAPIDTITPGPHTFTLVCVDEFGTVATATATYTVTAPTLTGRAFGLSLGGLIPVVRTPDTGEVATQQAFSTSTPCTSTLRVGLALVAHSLCANVTTSLEPSTATASASVGDTALAVPAVPAITIGPASATSTASCEGAFGSTTVAFVKIGNLLVFSSPVPPAPNTTINVGLVEVVVNEQLPAAGPGKGLTVNAVHVTSPANGSLVNLVVASARSGISTCPS